MKELVMNVINISGQAAVIFVALFTVRGLFALGKVPKKYAYGLWAIFFIRLLLPIQMEACWGLMPQISSFPGVVESEADSRDRSGQEKGAISSDWYNMPEGRPDVQSVWQEIVLRQAQENDVESSKITGSKGYAENSRFAAEHRGRAVGSGAEKPAYVGHFSLWTAIAIAWIAGSILFIGYGVFSYIRLKKRLCCSLRLEGWGERVYLADGIETPFVLGFTAPGIYLPSNMADKSIPYVIAHERIHIRRRDYLIKLGAYLLTCLYWFHPLAWAGFVLMSRDMEMSCDEAVLRQMSGDCREAYADSLLQLTCGKHYPTAAPLAFGEGNTRNRIKHIMRYKKAVGGVAAAAVVLTGILAAVLLASPRKVTAEDHKGQPESIEQTAAGASEGDVRPVDGRTATEDGSQGFSFQVAYRDVVTCPLPVMTGNTSLGADGAILDYVDEDKVIFHGYFGLYIYSVSLGETIGAVDLRALGCGDTQGDNTCQVFVSQDGSKVYFYPLGGIEGMESSEQERVIYSYVYDIQGGRLQLAAWKQEQPEDSGGKMNFPQMMGEELAESKAVMVEQWERRAWEQGFFSDYGIVYEKDGESFFGYLKSASGTLEDLVYVQRPVYGENPGAVMDGGSQWEAVGLFGVNGKGTSTVSYGPEIACPITIDGRAYELGKAMTVYRMGDETVESPQGNDSVNAITGLQYLDGLWIVEGHIDPSHNTYSFYDPAAGEWICHIIAACLTWGRSDEGKELILWEENRERALATVIYALDNRIYSIEDGLVAVLSQEELEQKKLGLAVLIQGESEQEEICGLYWYGDEITVAIRSPQMEESRIVQFQYRR